MSEVVRNKRSHVFTLSSPVMKNGGKLAKKYAGNDRRNPNCDGGNVSLPLRWSNAPAGTKSFAITMFDPLGRRGLGVVHWVAYDIPRTWKSLRSGAASKAPKGFAGGRNTVGSFGLRLQPPIDLNTLPGSLLWAGPCPRLGEPSRPYTIVLVATDVSPGVLPPDLTYYQLSAALYGRALDAAAFTVRYR